MNISDLTFETVFVAGATLMTTFLIVGALVVHMYRIRKDLERMDLYYEAEKKAIEREDFIAAGEYSERAAMIAHRSTFAGAMKHAINMFQKIEPNTNHDKSVHSIDTMYQDPRIQKSYREAKEQMNTCSHCSEDNKAG